MQNAMLRAVRAGHGRMDPRLRLPHIQMTPGAIIGMILNQAGLAARRAGQSSVVVADEHMDFFARNVDINPGDVPWGTQLQEGGQGNGVALRNRIIQPPWHRGAWACVHASALVAAAA